MRAAASAGTVTAALSGNATTASTLQTSRNINGVGFNGSADITVADGTKLPLVGGTVTGQLIPTRSGNTGDGLGHIYINGGTSNRIDLSSAGVGLPTIATRPTGTKLVLYPSVTATRTDYARGIDGGVLWTVFQKTTTH